MNGKNKQHLFLKVFATGILPSVVILLGVLSYANSASEVNGLSFEQQGKATALTVDIDSAKANGAKIEKKKNGTVVIHLPKSHLPNAYQQYGLPPIQDQQSGLSATVQKKADGLEIIIPAAAAKNLKVQLKSSMGVVTPIGNTMTSSPTLKPSPVAKTPVKPVNPLTSVIKPVAKTPLKIVKQAVKPSPATSQSSLKTPPFVARAIIKPAPKNTPVKVVTLEKAKAFLPKQSKTALTLKPTPKTTTLPVSTKLTVGPIVPLKTTNTKDTKPVAVVKSIASAEVSTQPSEKISEKPPEKLMGTESTDSSAMATTPTTTKLPSLLTPTNPNHVQSVETTEQTPNSIQKLIISPYMQWFFLVCGILGVVVIMVIFAVSVLLRTRGRHQLSPGQTHRDSLNINHDEPLYDAETIVPPQQTIAPSKPFEEHLHRGDEYLNEEPAGSAVSIPSPIKQSNTQPIPSQPAPVTTDMRFAQLAQSRKKRF